MVLRCTVLPRWTSSTASAAAIVVLPTPPLPITITSPWPAAPSSSTSASRLGEASSTGPRPRRLRGVRGCDRGKQRAQRRQADHVEGPQRHVVPRQAPQRLRHLRQGRLPRRSIAAATGSSGWLDRGKTAFTTRRWLRTPSAAVRPACGQPRAARRGRGASPDHGRACRDRSGRPSASKRVTLHLQPGVRPEAGGAAIVRLEERVHALGRLSSRSVWPVGAVSNTTWS